MTRRTVLHLIHTGGAGGAETVMEQLIQHMDGTSWRFIAGGPPGGWLWSALERAPATLVPMPHSRAFDWRFVQRIVAAAREHEVDLIHTHLFGPTVYGSLAARILRLPLVATIHGAVDLSVANKWWGAKTRLIRRRRNRFVAVTEALRSEMVGQLSIPPTACQVIRNGVDISRFTPSPHLELREQFGWTSNEIVVGAVGNVRHPKDYDTLLDAAHLVRARSPDCRFVILGDTEGEPDLYGALLAKRRALGLEATVVFAGFRDDIIGALRGLDVFVMSSVKEGLPLAVLQAMATRLPIVATRCGGPDEILTHDQSACLVPVRDPRALAEGITRLAQDAALRDRLAGAACDTVNRLYTVDRMAREYEELYTASLDDPHAPD